MRRYNQRTRKRPRQNMQSMKVELRSFTCHTDSSFGMLPLNGVLCISFSFSSSSQRPLYNAEVAPQHARGLLVSLQQLAITFGILLAFVSNLGFADHGYWRGSLWCQTVRTSTSMTHRYDSPLSCQTVRTRKRVVHTRI